MKPLWHLTVVRERTEVVHDGRTAVTTSAAVYTLLRPYFAALDREHFVTVTLDGKNSPIGYHTVSVGTLTASLVHPREVFKVALLENAAAILLAHNHPSGDPTPSAEDIAITQRLREAGELLGTRVLDHVVFGDDRYVSFTDHGL